MIKIFNNIRKNRNKGERYVPNTSLFPELDIEKIAGDLNVIQRAEDNGKLDSPSSSTITYDGVESEIIDYIHREKDRSYEIAVDYFNGYSDRLNTLSKGNNFHKIEMVRRDILSKFESTISINEDSSFFSTRKDINNLREELKVFKKNNQIKREPNFLDSRVLTFGLVLLVFVLESVLNAVFFAKGHDLGYLGGISISILISIVNIALIGIIFGWYFSRNIVHNNVYKKLLGCLMLPISCSMAFFFNLVVAHYRYAYSIASENPEITALNNFLNSPFSLGDIESYFLVIVGCTFCFITTIKFWKSFDPYPGYETRTRKLTALEEDYAEEKSSLIYDLSEIKDVGLGRMESYLKEFEGSKQEYPKALSRITSMKAQFEQHLNTLQQNGRSLLSQYRMTNKQFRESPAPIFWNEPWCINYPDLSILIVDKTLQQNDLMTANSKDAKKLIKDVYDAYDKNITKIEMLATLK